MFFLCQECSVNIMYGLVYSLQCIGRLDSAYQYRLSGIKSEYIGLILILLIGQPLFFNSDILTYERASVVPVKFPQCLFLKYLHVC